MQHSSVLRYFLLLQKSLCFFRLYIFSLPLASMVEIEIIDLLFLLVEKKKCSADYQ